MKFLTALQIFIITSYFLPASVLATLGGRLNSIQSDQTAIQGSKKIISKNHFQIYELTSDLYTIREYVSPKKVIFAVSWKGTTQPNLSLLLGRYFEEYQAASTSVTPPVNRGHRVIHTKHITVEKYGHMRDVQGKAYIPRLIPSGVNIRDIQ